MLRYIDLICIELFKNGSKLFSVEALKHALVECGKILLWWSCQNRQAFSMIISLYFLFKSLKCWFTRNPIFDSSDNFSNISNNFIHTGQKFNHTSSSLLHKHTPLIVRAVGGTRVRRHTCKSWKFFIKL